MFLRRLPSARIGLRAGRGLALFVVSVLAAGLPGPAVAAGGTGSIAGTVYDAGGMPVANVLVFACHGSCQYATSAASGAFSIGNLAADTYRIGIEDLTGTVPGGYATAIGITLNPALAAPVVVGIAPVTFDVHGTASARIKGTITAQAGGPVSGAFVGACQVVAVPADQDFIPCSFEDSAADGTYSVPVLPGSYQVSVEDFGGVLAAGYYSATGYVFSPKQATTVSVAAADVVGIDVALPAGASIAGTVTDPTGAPVSLVASRACLTTDITACSLGFTGADGTYTINGLPLGSYTVSFQDPAGLQPSGFYSTTGFTGDSGLASAVAVGASGATGIDIKFVVGHLVSGVVTNSAGQPLFNAEITDCTSKFCLRIARTEADGSYHANLAPGKHYLHAGDYTGANVSGYYSAAGLANAAHTTALTIGSADLAGINLKLGRITGGVHPGTVHSGKYVASTVVPKGTYVTTRFLVGKPFAGTKVSIMRASKSSTGTWSAYKRVATVGVAADGYAYYSTKPSGYMAFKAALTDSLVEGVTYLSPAVFARGK